MDWIHALKTRTVHGIYFIRFVIKHFFADDCPYRASALAFTSLLAVVPLMTVGFAILSSFPVFQGLSQPVQDFIFENFVPNTGKLVQNYLQQFAAQVSRLSIWGVAFLFVTAILLMVTIERAMNKIWRTTSARHGTAAFLLYWAILSLAPIFLGLSLAASSYLLSIFFFQNTTPSLLLNIIPFLLSFIGFTFLYVIVPNCPVKLTHGLIGAFVTTTLFESAKEGFAFYLSHYNSYELLYGAFATVPIFFVWVYWVWFITLLGAEVSYALSVHYQRRQGPPLDGFSHALLWLQQLWMKQQKGEGMLLEELIETTERPFSVDNGRMIHDLSRLHLIHMLDDGRFILSRDLHDISLYWLSQHLPYRLPTPQELEQEKALQTFNLHAVFEKGQGVLQQEFDISLTKLFALNTPSDK